MSLIEICFVGFNVVAILDIILIMKNLYGLDIHIHWKWFWSIMVIYYGANLVVTYLEIHEKTGTYTGMWLTYGFLYFLTLIFSQKYRGQNLLWVFPAVITYGEWTQIVALFEHLFGIDKHYIFVQGSKITPLYFFQDLSLLAILLYIEKKGVKEEYKTRLTWLDGMFITVSCIFFFVLVELLLFRP